MAHSRDLKLLADEPSEDKLALNLIIQNQISGFIILCSLWISHTNATVYVAREFHNYMLIHKA